MVYVRPHTYAVVLTVICVTIAVHFTLSRYCPHPDLSLHTSSKNQVAAQLRRRSISRASKEWPCMTAHGEERFNVALLVACVRSLHRLDTPEFDRAILRNTSHSITIMPDEMNPTDNIHMRAHTERLRQLETRSLICHYLDFLLFCQYQLLSLFPFVFDDLNFLLGLSGRLPTQHLLLQHVCVRVLIADVVGFL